MNVKASHNPKRNPIPTLNYISNFKPKPDLKANPISKPRSRFQTSGGEGAIVPV